MTNKYHDFSSRCRACNNIMNTFMNTKRLPDGSFDDLCTVCKTAIHDANHHRYVEYIHEFSHEEEVTSAVNMDSY